MKTEEPKTVAELALTKDEWHSLWLAWSHAGEGHADDCPSLKVKMVQIYRRLNRRQRPMQKEVGGV